MARYFALIDVPRPVDEAFEYVADFSNTAEWDPGVVEAENLVEGPVGVGSLFRVVVKFFGRRLEARYEMTAHEAPKRVVLEAHRPGFYSHDEIRCEPTAEGTRITYDATLELKGFAAVGDRLLDAAFQRVGDRAAAGLRSALGG